MKNSAAVLPAIALCIALCASPLSYAEPPTASDSQASADQPQAVDAGQEKIRDTLEKIASQAKIIDLLKDDITQLNADIKTAQDEERAVLRDQRRRKQEEIRNNIQALVKSINELESAGHDSSDGREMAVAYVRQVSVWLKADIADSLKLLARLDEQVKTASESDAPELRQQITNEREAVDEALTALLENSDSMGLLGLDNRPDLKYLDGTLMQRADSLVARLQYLVQQRNGLSEQVAGAGEDEKKRLKEKVTSLDARIASTADNLKITIDLMNLRKLEAAKYKQILISSTGEITKEIFQSGVALGLFQQWLGGGKQWLINHGPQWAFKLIVFVLIMVIFGMLSKTVKRVSSRALAASRLHTSKLLQDLFVSLAGKAIFLVGILIALAQVGVQIGPLLAGLGIVGFIVGFALQETLSNFAAGVMILVYRPFDVGDAIEAGGISGKVKHMSLVSTTITTFDNQRVIVPNKKIWGDVIRNMNAEEERRIDMSFGIGYDDDIAHAEKVLHEIIDNYELVLDDPPAVIQLHSLGESSVDFIVRPWVKTSDYWTAYWYITRAVKQRFDAEGISIPFPQRDMHIYHHENAPAKSTI